jgi:hypothetical protein
VESGDYGIIRTRDNKFIERSEFPNSVEPGMMVEMSIILLEEKPVLYPKGKSKCPRCSHINVFVTANSGWIDWEVLSISINLFNDVYYSRNCAVKFQKESVVTFRSSATCGNADIISPAPYVFHSILRNNVQPI